MTDDALRHYRLGLRFRQAVITLGYAERCRTTAGFAHAQSAFNRLLAAINDWPGLGGVMGASWNLQLEGLVGDLIRRRRCPEAEAEDLTVTLEHLAVDVRQWVQGRHPGGTATAAWFALGDAVAQVQVDEGDTTKGANGLPPNVAVALTELGADRAALFRDHGDGAFVDTLPPFGYVQAWVALEGGLAHWACPPAGRPRPRAERDHQLLRMYEAAGADTHRSPTRVRARWNRLHPDDKMQLDAVKKALTRARAEREVTPPAGGDGPR
ncbi:hypothetical protein [Limnoglobus roseus]|uniref:Uncharacterized protein n=1 Tax=Limnoglobus roseus TaxID=2598579 RepID=A0A5C1AE48_9BACT|nr:hypothetical protein [Limnoglobus roseus]QEL17659.1 hypothetical protein PX52LOC_04657 [Limnoglobus roseus]